MNNNQENSTQISFIHNGFANNTKFIMFNGQIKNIQDINIGDNIMTYNSEPTQVLEISIKNGEIYKIIPTKGKPFFVSENQILTLICCGYNKIPKGHIEEISLQDYLNKSDTWKTRYKLLRTGVHFNEDSSLPLDPYAFGLWLVKSYNSSEKISKINPIIQSATEQYFSNKSEYEHLKNHFKTFLTDNNLTETKYIPHIFKISSKNDRYKLLAGILDGDGSYSHNVYEIFQKNEELLDDIIFIVRSLGLSAYKSISSRYKINGQEDFYYRCTISGDGIHNIPCLLPEKQANPRLQNKNNLVTGLRVSFDRMDDYYCLKLSGEKRILLDDFTVVNGC